jgi:hypothetical protein
MLLISLNFSAYCPPEMSNRTLTIYTPEKSIEAKKQRILMAFISIESNGNELAWNIKENARGVLQIRPILIREVFRISSKRYLLKDRLNKSKSIEIFWIIQDYYNPDLNLKEMCKTWNGRGKSKQGNFNYYTKIKNYYENNSQTTR